MSSGGEGLDEDDFGFRGRADTPDDSVEGDGAKKKRIGSLKRRYPTSIACLAFSPSGEQLAVAASYTYENGEQKAPPDAIYLQKVSDSPATFKPKAEKAK